MPKHFYPQLISPPEAVLPAEASIDQIPVDVVTLPVRLKKNRFNFDDPFVAVEGLFGDRKKDWDDPTSIPPKNFRLVKNRFVIDEPDWEVYREVVVFDPTTLPPDAVSLPVRLKKNRFNPYDPFVVLESDFFVFDPSVVPIDFVALPTFKKKNRFIFKDLGELWELSPATPESTELTQYRPIHPAPYAAKMPSSVGQFLTAYVPSVFSTAYTALEVHYGGAAGSPPLVALG